MKLFSITSKRGLGTIVTAGILLSSVGGITPGQTYPFQANYAWSNGDTINVVVTTARTSIYTTQVVAPP